MDLEKLKADLRRDEGLRLTSYLCPAGVATVGYGHTGPNIHIGMVIDESTAEKYLACDIAGVFHDLDMHAAWWRELPEPAARGLANAAFNLGWPRLSLFKMMLQALKAGVWEVASTEALRSAWANQVGARARRIAALFREAESGTPTA